MGSASVVISENPVTSWESFHQEIPVRNLLEDSLKLVDRDMGGFYSASFVLETDNRELAIDYLNNGPGRQLHVYNDKSNVDWEGFINRITIDRGSAKTANWLDRMENKVWTRYQPIGGGSVTRSTVYNSTLSQSRFGIKEGVINGGQLGAAEAAQKANTHLQQVFWPTPELEGLNFGADAFERARLVFSCLGWWHTLGWRTYNQTALTGTVGASSLVSTIVTAVGQFVASSTIQANATPVTRELDADRRAGEMIESICDLGDSNFLLYVAGMEAGRKFYYRQAAPERVVV
jgi:hypothetical protein